MLHCIRYKCHDDYNVVLLDNSVIEHLRPPISRLNGMAIAVLLPRSCYLNVE